MSHNVSAETTLFYSYHCEAEGPTRFAMVYNAQPVEPSCNLAVITAKPSRYH